MRGVDRAYVLALTMAFLSATYAAAAPMVRVGTGVPDLSGWCRMDWLAGCPSGVGALSGGTGELTLVPTQTPPPSAVEFSLKLLPYRTLLFLLSGVGGGHLELELDGTELARVPLASGQWWIVVDGLPSQGILRLELDERAETLTVKSVYFPCSAQCPACPGCRDDFLWGALIGAVTTWVLLYLFVLR